MEIPDVLKVRTQAVSICVTRQGAVPSIPYRSEVDDHRRYLCAAGRKRVVT